MNDYTLLNGTTLAYIGDSYYDLCIRKYLIDNGYTKGKALHKQSTRYVSAKSQSLIIKYFREENFLTEEEENIVKRGRNAKVKSNRRNTDILTYKHSTSYEALIGYLYLTKQQERLDYIVDTSINIVEKW
ncbi:Mini-ribonuclease 3 [Haloplasma contractile]|uniref:Mini-ribonuclease 3 n=1 Tax=Haloplasma contractile SSD-17B TaxID=1033810 RepID=U2ECA1_9MOLU|nr:ribonuclease III domain-containing protein [Haloplasma contractile]ERJ12406.1 Mini-ribonuclease 3 protein [Haloplasma contractile SSD-17B]